MEIKERLNNNFLLFLKIVFSQLFYYDFCSMHKEISELVSNPENKKINLIAPRGTAKSSIIARGYTMWRLAKRTRPETIVLCSKTQGLSIQHLQIIKDALDYNEVFRSIYGYQGSQVAKKWANDSIILADGTTIIAKGTGQQIRGLNLYSRTTLFIGDDLEDENNTKTDDSMKMNLDWLFNGALPSLDPNYGQAIIIGTPLHQNCIVEVLDRASNWISKRWSAIKEDGMALWPEQYSLEKLAEIKQTHESIGRLSGFYREYLCQCMSEEEQIFRPEFVQYYDGYIQGDTLILTEINGEPVNEKRLVNIFMGIDPASSTKQTADYSTIVTIAVDNQENRFVLPYFRERVKPFVLADNIIQNFKKYNPIKVRIESVGYQEMLRDYIRNYEGLYIPGAEIQENPRTSKSSRIESMEPYFYKRKIYLMKNMKELEDELFMYPRGKNDDLLDGLYYANKNTFKAFENNSLQNDVNNNNFTFKKPIKSDRDKMKNNNNSWMSV